MIQPPRFAAVAFSVALALVATNHKAGQGAFPGPGRQGGGARGNQSPPLPTGSGLIEGIVQSGDTMRPLDQVTITLMMYGPNGAGQSARSTVITDSSGHFSFPNVATILFSIVAQRDGYFGRSEIGTLGPTTSTSGALSTSRSHVELVLSLTPTLTITGRVTNWTGESVSNIQVDAMTKQYKNGEFSLVSMKTGTSDDRGIYRLFGLLPGEYYVRALAKPAAPFATTYFAEVPSANSAINLVLKTGTEPVSDVRLLQSSPVKVSGRAVLPDTAVVAREQFWLVPQNAPYVDSLETEMSSTVQGSKPGLFQLQAKLPGAYHLFYSVQTRRSTPASDSAGPVYSARMTIDVRNTDIENVTLNPTPTTELEVRFNLNGDVGLAPPGVPNLLALVPLDHSLPTELRPTLAPGARSRTGPVASADPRKFSNVIEGQYRLFPGVREGGLQVDGYISDMRQGGKDIIENGIISVGTGSPDPVVITLKRGGATVQGVVQDSGRPPGTAFVMLIPNGSRRQNPVLYRRYVTEPDGRFTLQGLSPGSYTIFAWASDPAGAELIPEFIQRYAEIGLPIVLNANSAPSGISVPLIRSLQ